MFKLFGEAKEILEFLLTSFVHDSVMIRGWRPPASWTIGSKFKYDDDTKKTKQGGQSNQKSQTARQKRKLLVSNKLTLVNSRCMKYLQVEKIIDTALILPALIRQYGQQVNSVVQRKPNPASKIRLDDYVKTIVPRMEDFLAQKLNLMRAIEETISTNKSFEEQLPVWTGFKNQFTVLCDSIRDIGLVSDLQKLVETGLECLLWCSKLIDELKIDLGRLRMRGENVFARWLEDLRRLRGDRPGQPIYNGSGEWRICKDLIRRFAVKRDEIDSILRRCGTISLHLPILVKRSGATGSALVDMFKGLTGIIEERADVVKGVCRAGGMKQSKQAESEFDSGILGMDLIAELEEDEGGEDDEDEIGESVSEFFEDFAKLKMEANGYEDYFEPLVKRLATYEDPDRKSVV